MEAEQARLDEVERKRKKKEEELIAQIKKE